MKSKQKGGGQYTIQRVDDGHWNSSHINDDHDLVVVVNHINNFISEMETVNGSNPYIKLQNIIRKTNGNANISLEKYIGHFVHIIDKNDSDHDHIALTYEILDQSPPVDAADAVAASTGGKSRKSRKSRKSCKSRKTRKSRKSRKH